ncbi:MAG: hypothetical protein HN742_11100 [Lentisphaerae bacterium]|nr:hypothetical protein [Lentisphaerota bacterium]MBT5610500.1 hypothetical protein [Lentisphaerota bacterium]MBT7056055.1 hypothetical protein [Lentisphaerota bacterium]MBT7842412.1 hypothetical protein [Lentisphaerota bacterium]MBT7914461.1 hypothetical protein [Candidatus Bathyarchaeota archaeon]
MIDVNVLVIEDESYDEQSSLLPCSKGGLSFHWHPSFGNRIDPDEPNTLESARNMLAGNDSTWGALNGYGIVILDMGFGLLSPSDEERNVYSPFLSESAAQKLHSSATRCPVGIGLLLAHEALSNSNWQGVLVVASSRGGASDEILEAIESMKAHYDSDVVITQVRKNFAESVTAADDVLRKGIGAFLARFGSIDARLWPKDCSEWFRDDNAVVTHQYSKLKPEGKKQLADYLETVLTFPPPDSWFEEDQCGVLFEDLKHLVGSRARVHVGDTATRTLTLGNLVILLASSTPETASRWIPQVRWVKGCESVEILCRDMPKDDIREVVYALTGRDEAETKSSACDGLFTVLEKDEFSNIPLISTVVLQPHLLEVQLAFDASAESKNRPALLAGLKTMSGEGTTISALRRFVRSAANSPYGWDGRCMVNVVHKGAATQPTKLIFRPVKDRRL